MKNKLSFKIGLLFLVFILIIGSLLFFILYTNLANDRIDEVMDSLLARGNTHRDVLEDYYNHATLEHVGIMESASEFIVVITDKEDQIILSSDPVDADMLAIMQDTNSKKIAKEGEIIEDQWTEVPYVATDSPITLDGEHQGHVYMFVHTDYVKRTVDQLSKQFITISIITLVLTIITIFILSRLITQPLIKMKIATEQLSKGKHNVRLHTNRTDELGELANSITTLSRDLKQLKQERNEFLASISHELRTPLTYIQGYANMMNRPNVSEDELAHFSHIIQEETEQVTNLIKNLFELAQIDEHNFVIEREEVILYDLIERVITRIEPVLAHKEISLKINCDEQMTIPVDPERMQQVLINLLDNAQKHTYPKTTITIDVTQTLNEVTITLMDEGEGIPKKDLPYIFDRLYRVDKSRSRERGGSGLGLAITKEIIEAHDGTIAIESEVGQGTTVRITLPKH